MTGAARWLLAITLALCGAGSASKASAGGYDTPILYSARHLGVGGAAVAYVDDPSAIFHNPAGLGRIGNASALADFSLLVGTLRATPGATSAARDLESEPTVAPLFLVGGAYRVHERVALGAAVYPVASAGAAYRYEGPVGTVEDRTQLVFIEMSPGLAISLPAGFELGASYRVTLVTLDRANGPRDDPAIDFSMSGFNFLGARVGLQWHGALPAGALSLGASYRTRTTTTIENDHGDALYRWNDISTDFTLPSRLVFGERYDIGPLSVLLDVERGFNSENVKSTLKGTCDTDQGASDTDVNAALLQGCQMLEPDGVDNVFRWTDAWTLRTGLEWRLLDDRLPLRVGYIWDQKTGNPQYPTAFGTPPGPSHVLTLGGGWADGPWRLNLAYALRRVTGDVTDADLGADDRDPCPFCSYAGEQPYDMTLHGIFADASYDWR